MSVSARASPGGGTTAGRSWISDCASWLISKPIFSPSRSKAEATGSTTSASSAVGFMNRSSVGVEVERLERLAAVAAVGMGQQHVGAEADQGAHGVGRSLEDGPIQIAVCRPSPSAPGRAGARRGPASGPSAGPRAGPGRRSRAAGGRREQHVAAGPVERAGEGVEQRHRARRLGDVGVVLVAAPGVVGHRARMPDQPRGFLDLGARNPADRLDRLRRVAPAEPAIELERRVADDLALRSGDPVLAIQREAAGVAVVTAGRRVIRHEPRGRAVPGEDAARRRRSGRGRARSTAGPCRRAPGAVRCSSRG